MIVRKEKTHWSCKRVSRVIEVGEVQPCLDLFFQYSIPYKLKIIFSLFKFHLYNIRDDYSQLK